MRKSPRLGAWVLTLLALLVWAPLGAGAGVAYQAAKVSPPTPTREFRGVWIATVDNIDWPSRKGLSSAEQKAELVALLERAAELKLNTVLFQVRPACDALYASSIEPWSECLTGEMGKAPEPFYDPLAFAIEEAHKRGLELHAWFNPYRAHHHSGKSPISGNHISKTHPNLVRQYGKQLWLDPGEKEVQDYSLSVVMDVVRRYDVDGIHFDDYFYPYKEPDASGKEMDFPDNASWQRFGAGGKLERDDWRRQNVSQFIERVYKSIKATKPWVKFGVSPFGIWRPGNPPQIRGHDAYAKLYADSRKWLVNGWVDYFVPQLYWAISPPDQSFPVLLKWWSEQNAKGRLLVAGMDSSRTAHQWKPEEIVNQIRLERKQAGAGGHAHWSMKTLCRNTVLDEALAREVYSQPALVPAMPWLDRVAPAKPQLKGAAAAHSVELTWCPGNQESVRFWVLQVRHGKTWTMKLLPGNKMGVELEGPLPEAVALTALDGCGNASAPAGLQKTAN